MQSIPSLQVQKALWKLLQYKLATHLWSIWILCNFLSLMIYKTWSMINDRGSKSAGSFKAWWSLLSFPVTTSLMHTAYMWEWLTIIDIIPSSYLPYESQSWYKLAQSRIPLWYTTIILIPNCTLVKHHIPILSCSTDAFITSTCITRCDYAFVYPYPKLFIIPLLILEELLNRRLCARSST